MDETWLPVSRLCSWLMFVVFQILGNNFLNINNVYIKILTFYEKLAIQIDNDQTYSVRQMNYRIL